MDTYSEVYYHFVWATKKRDDYLTDLVWAELRRCIPEECRKLRVQVYALGGMADHVHIACSLPTSLSIADFMRLIKGGSANLINRRTPEESGVTWQSGYGVLTVSKEHLKAVVAYVENQPIHHADATTKPRLEQVGLPPSTKSRRDDLRQ